MKIAFFDTHLFEKELFLMQAQEFHQEVHFFDFRLTERTVQLAEGFPCVCVFVNDRLNAHILETLAKGGTRLIALRSAGYNHVDLQAAHQLGLTVVRVPEYSPYAVAEHAVALLLSLNRKIHRAYNRVREGNFSLDGLVGFDLFQKNIGIVGTGKIGSVMAKIMLAFGCKVMACDKTENPQLKDLGVQYTTLEHLMQNSDVVSLHVPLNAETKYLINEKTLSHIKPNMILINTGRGALIETKALIKALKEGRIGGACLDVYEEEEGVFFSDLSNEVLKDDILARLLTFHNVLITSHQGFLTNEALHSIAKTTLENITLFEKGQTSGREISHTLLS